MQKNTPYERTGHFSAYVYYILGELQEPFRQAVLNGSLTKAYIYYNLFENYCQ